MKQGVVNNQTWYITFSNGMASTHYRCNVEELVLSI